MKAIHVLRKPCSESTVAGNVIKFGAGALNIDAARIQMTPEDREVITSMGGFGSEGWANTTSPAYNTNNPKNPMVRTQAIAHSQGRWPANLVLQHRSECQNTGVKSVKVVGATAHRAEHSTKSNASVGTQSHDHTGFKNKDGKETVVAYDCAPGCPVAVLDSQTANLQPSKGGYVRKHGADQFLGSGLGDGRTDTPTGVIDAGGASRFFKQFGGKSE